MAAATSMSKHNRGTRRNVGGPAQSKLKSLKFAVKANYLIFCSSLKEDEERNRETGGKGGASNSPPKQAKNIEEQPELEVFIIPERAHSALGSSKLRSILELGEVPRGAKCLRILISQGYLGIILITVRFSLS